MSRKPPKGYYVDGELVAPEGSVRPGGRGDPDAPSRTERKNASEDLQKVGEALVALRADALAGLELPEKLHDAITEAKRLGNHGARRRQLQFIGKLMRKLDAAALEAVYAAVARAQRG